MTSPHRTLRCAACGAHPHWVLSDPNDPRPTPLCSHCAVVNDRGSSPPPQPVALPRVPVAPAAAPARGSTVPTPLALVAVMIASFLPNAAVAVSDSSGRLRRAFEAALVALSEDVHEPLLVAATQRVRSMAPAAIATPVIAPQATVIPLGCGGARSSDPVARSVLVTRAIARDLPARVGLREGDRIVAIDGVSPVNAPTNFRVCTASKRSFVLEWTRDGTRHGRTIACADGAGRHASSRRVFARR